MARRRIKTRYPRNIENSYLSVLNGLIRKWKKEADKLAKYYLYPCVKGGQQILKTDAEDPMDDVINRLNAMSFGLQDLQPDLLLNQATQQYVRALNTFSYKNVKAQTAIIGINPVENDKNLSNYLKGKAMENMKLVQNMKDDWRNKIASDLYREVTQGCSIKDITADILKRTNMAYSHAKIIANDQTGTIISDLNTYRNKQAGAGSYIWQTMEDDRVRPAHQDLDGKQFDYDDPNGGDDGQLPGQPINCRCVATPVFD